MLKWERKLVEYIDRWLPELVFVLVTLIAVFMRRDGLWHVCLDYQNAFYPEAPGYLHTPFYMLFIQLICYIPITPIRTLKMIIGLFDFGVALGSILLLRSLKGQGIHKYAVLACYVLCLITPLSIENGITWIHVDAICLCAVLGAALLYRKRKYLWVGLLLGMAAALQAQYLVFLLAACAIGIWKNKKMLPWLSVGAVIFTALTVAGSVWSGSGFYDSLFMLVNWLVIDPKSGMVFTGFLSWLAAMAGHFGYVAGMLAMLYAFYRPRYWWAAVAIHMGAVLYLGQILQYGY